MTIPINQLLSSIKSQSENLNAQSKVLHSLSDTIMAQRKEFNNVKKDMGDLKKNFAQNLSGISEIKKYLDSMRKGTGINGTQIGPKSGAGGASPDKGFFTNLFTKMFGPSKYQQNLLNEISILKDITDLQSKDIRFIKNQYSDKTKAYDREMLATAIANKLNNLGNGGGGRGMLGGLAAGAGSLLGGLGSLLGGVISALGPALGVAIAALGGVLRAAIVALGEAIVAGLAALFGKNLLPSGGPAGSSPGGGRGAPPVIVPPGGGPATPLPGPSNPQLPNDGKGKGKFKPKGFGGAGQPITDVAPKGRLSGALKGAGWIAGLLIAADILTEASQNPDKSFTDILKDVGSSLNPFSGFKGPASQVDDYLKRKKEKEDKVTGAVSDDDKKFREDMLAGAKKSAEKLQANDKGIISNLEKDMSSWGDKFKEMLAEGLKGFLTLEDKLEDFIEQTALEGYKKSIEPMLNDIGFNMDVPDAQGNMVSKKISLSPSFGTSLGEALNETYQQSKELMDPAKEAMANYATNIINNNVNNNNNSSGSLPATNAPVYNRNPTMDGMYRFLGSPVQGK